MCLCINWISLSVRPVKYLLIFYWIVFLSLFVCFGRECLIMESGCLKLTAMLLPQPLKWRDYRHVCAWPSLFSQLKVTEVGLLPMFSWPFVILGFTFRSGVHRLTFYIWMPRWYSHSWSHLTVHVALIGLIMCIWNRGEYAFQVGWGQMCKFSSWVLVA